MEFFLHLFPTSRYRTSSFHGDQTIPLSEKGFDGTSSIPWLPEWSRDHANQSETRAFIVDPEVVFPGNRHAFSLGSVKGPEHGALGGGGIAATWGW